MKVSGKIIIPLLLLVYACLHDAHALEVPEHPEGRITDFTSTLSTSEISHLDQELAAYEKQTTNQIAVLMIPSLEGDNLEDYSIRLAGKWKIGQKGKDNGVILLIVKNDRKLRIEVGYGLEGVLPDGLAGSIIRDEITPLFRKNKFYEGINRGTDAIIRAISPGLHPITPEERAAPFSEIPRWALWMLIALVVGFGVLPLLVGPLIGGYWDWLVEKAKHPGGFGFWSYVVIFLGSTVGWLLLYSWGDFHTSSLMAIIGGALIFIAIIVSVLDQRKIRRSRQGIGGVGYGPVSPLPLS